MKGKVKNYINKILEGNIQRPIDDLWINSNNELSSYLYIKDTNFIGIEYRVFVLDRNGNVVKEKEDFCEYKNIQELENYLLEFVY